MSSKMQNYMKYYKMRMSSVFGEDWFGLKAESFARFFGTPLFIIIQTVIVVTWIILNATNLWNFDLYPFILLNLAFSLQAAYAAPLILLAQTRQADRDKAHAQSDDLHKQMMEEEYAKRRAEQEENTRQLIELVRQNTELTMVTKELSERIEHILMELKYQNGQVNQLITEVQEKE